MVNGPLLPGEGVPSMKVAVGFMGYVWRPLTDSEADTEFVLKLRNSPRAHDGFFTRSITRDEHLRFLRSPVREEEFNWIIEQAGGERIGTSGLCKIDRKDRRAESARIISVEAPVFAVDLVVKGYVVFEHLGLNKLVAETLATNSVVNCILQSIGGACEGRLREHVFRDGAFVDVVLYGALASDWRRLKPSLIAQFGEPHLIRHHEDDAM
jgi:RimJ/RimL family protein N-acetyltransferase